MTCPIRRSSRAVRAPARIDGAAADVFLHQRGLHLVAVVEEAAVVVGSKR
jgi:hypothetical protein